MATIPGMDLANDALVASGGFCAPLWPPSYPREGDLFYVTYRVRNPLRRWWLRRQGWSTEWTVEYEYVPVRKMIPSFTAVRGV